MLVFRVNGTSFLCHRYQLTFVLTKINTPVSLVLALDAMGSDDTNGIRHIPLASLTAFRLAYFGENPKLISHLSSSQFYGPIPNIWQVESLRHRGKQQYRRRMVKSKLQDSLERWQSTVPEANDHQGPLSHGFNIYLSNHRNAERILHNWTDDIADVEDSSALESSDEESRETRFSRKFGLSKDDELNVKSLSAISPGETTATHSDTMVDHSLTPPEMEVSPVGTFGDDNELHAHSSYLINEYDPAATHEGILEVPDTASTQRNKERLVRFSTKQSVTSSRRRMRYEYPQPQEEIDDDASVAEELPVKQKIRGMSDLETLEWLSSYKRRIFNQRLMRKLRREPKVKSNSLHNKIHRRLYNSLLKDYKDGEVIRAGKMLVLIESISDSTTRYYDDSTSHQYHVVERWAEYHVILRRMSEFSVQIEFYEMHAITSLTKKAPAFTCELQAKSPQLPKVSLYNATDKTICLAVKATESKKADKIYLYIMKCSDKASTLKWLYLMNLALEQTFDEGNNFQILVPELDRAISITLPNDFFPKILQIDETMTLKELPIGYKVIHTELIEYLKQQISEKLRIADVENWWFCFKSYDTIHWVENSSESLYLLNLFLSDLLQLQFRRKESHRLESEPIPCEGFLSRLTNGKGYRRSFGRPFYRMLYFYTSGPLLYYCKHYNAVPPEGIVGLADFNHVTTVLTALPTDDNSHFLLLEKGKEEAWKDDNRAIEEFERRAKHIAKARAVLDLCTVTNIRKLEKYDLVYDVLQFITWYAKPEYANAGKKSIFVLELDTGTEIWLQAANTEVRDAWCSHLQMIRDYWVERRRQQIQNRMGTRHENMRVFNINEYTDSNVNREIAISKDKVNLLSRVDLVSHSIDALALSKLTLESGCIYLKRKKHSSYTQFFLVLIPGFLIIYHLHPRSLLTHAWKRTSFSKHYVTIPIAECYIYLGQLSTLDLLDSQKAQELHDGHFTIPRIYDDGWKSQEEDGERCFSIWFGKKREIFGSEKLLANYKVQKEQFKHSGTHNPNYLRLVSRLGVTGNCIYLMARSRQEKDIWVSRIQGEIDRFG